ncbi:sensor histidine kinase [Microbacterium koreense]|uniref:histidine kinase n=1 Tax=Microbacterium koreense TaxID=323761 RepID=A0ABW2ZN55_9MICO
MKGAWQSIRKRAVLIALVAAGIALLPVAATLGATVYGIGVPASLLIAMLQAFAVAAVVIRPWVAVVTMMLGVVGTTLLVAPTATAPWPVPVATMLAVAITLAGLAVVKRWTFTATVWAVVVGWTLGVTALRPSHPAVPGAVAADLIVFAGVALLSLVVGVAVGRWSDTRRQLDDQRSATAREVERRELVEERARIARELHDVVAHGMSAIQVQAASARYRLPDLTEDAAREFDDVAHRARTAMTDMRHILDALRSDEADRAPQPGVADLPALLASPAHGGELVVDDQWRDDPPRDPLVGLTVYRVVQESLSNVARHARGAAVTITLSREAPDIVVTVRNAPPPAGVRAGDGGGHGLRGMRERAALVGGALRAAPTDDGGFIVEARLPERTEGR